MKFALQPTAPNDLKSFPSTRYQGSKRKLLPQLYSFFETRKWNNALDLYSGTATVSLLLRVLGCSVHANDILAFNRNAAYLFLNLTPSFLQQRKHETNLQRLLLDEPDSNRRLVEAHYDGIYFTPSENMEIDRFCQNLNQVEALERALYVYCVGQALLMKRPYNLFHRANLDMRLREVKRSFGNHKTWATSTLVHSHKILDELRRFRFSELTSTHRATMMDVADLTNFSDQYDLIYLDPPYLNARGLGVDYCDFYHFLEGLLNYDLFAHGDQRYPHRPIVKNRSAWNTIAGAEHQLRAVVENFPSATFALSYRTDGQPSIESISAIFQQCGRSLEEYLSKTYKYALAKSDLSREILLVSHAANKMR